MTEKKCSKCGEIKLHSDFYKSKTSKSGLSSNCTTCLRLYVNSHNRTRDGLIKVIYGNQLNHSRKRGHSKPSYSLLELREWCYRHVDFDRLYSDWVDSGYDKMKSPSIDRENDYEGYSFDNIRRICTWQENKNRFDSDRIKGINNKKSKEVNQLTMSGKFIKKWPSAMEAYRNNIAGYSSISACCRGVADSTKGFKWEFA